MDASRRRNTLGPYASAALPSLWKAIVRRNWTHADFARAVELSTSAASHLLYGDHRAGRKVAARIDEVLGVRLTHLWDKPCPPNWRPHTYPDLRKRVLRNQATGTDG